jgi:pilus assembly protein Flp/PilA
MYNKNYSFLRKEVNVLTDLHNKGQGLLEYALIISFVAIIVIVILYLLGPAVGNMFSNVVSSI